MGPCWQRGPCGPRPAELGVSAEGRAKAKAQGRRPATGTTPSLGAACAVAGCAQPAVMRAHTGRVPVGAARQLAPARTAATLAQAPLARRGATRAALLAGDQQAMLLLASTALSSGAMVRSPAAARCERAKESVAVEAFMGLLACMDSGEVREAERRHGSAPDAAQPRWAGLDVVTRLTACRTWACALSCVRILEVDLLPRCGRWRTRC